MLLLFSCSVVSDSVIPQTAAHQASLSFTISRSLLRVMSIESVMPSNHLILCHPFLLLPSIFPSIRVFSSELALCIRWPKYWSFSISPSNEYLGLISFRIDWFDLLAVQGTLESSPTSHFKSISSLALRLLYGPTLTSIHDYWKKHSFDYMDFCWKSNVCFLIHCLGLSQLFFQGASVLILWMQPPSAVILEPKKIKSVTISIVSLFAMKRWDQIPWS